MHNKGQTVHSPGQRPGVIYGNSKIKFYGILWLIDGHF